MAYVAIQGGADAIREAERLTEFLRARQGENGNPLGLNDIKHQFRNLHSRILSESGLHHDDLASLALKQTMGDPLEASFALRAYRSTKPRNVETEPLSTEEMRLVRRISAAFKDIPGGQMLGATPDYALRLLRFDLKHESPEAFQELVRDWLADLPQGDFPTTMSKVADLLRQRCLLPEREEIRDTPYDITREPLVFPLPRSASLQALARGETGGILTLAYSNMRGYGEIHPTVAELRVGYLPVSLPHPISGTPVEIGEVLMTECEMVAKHDAEEGDLSRFSIGYGACFGHNETKAIAMAVLDRCLQRGMRNGPDHPAENQEFVILHIDGIDSMGFCNHYKMPHYVTFQAEMDGM